LTTADTAWSAYLLLVVVVGSGCVGQPQSCLDVTRLLANILATTFTTCLVEIICYDALNMSTMLRWSNSSAAFDGPMAGSIFGTFLGHPSHCIPPPPIPVSDLPYVVQPTVGR
jgi:hypothetical protein